MLVITDSKPQPGFVLAVYAGHYPVDDIHTDSQWLIAVNWLPVLNSQTEDDFLELCRCASLRVAGDIVPG